MSTDERGGAVQVGRMRDNDARSTAKCKQTIYFARILTAANFA